MTTERAGFRQFDGGNWDDDDCPFELHWEEWLPANEISPAEYLIVGAETDRGLVEVYRRVWHDGPNTRADDRPEIIESVMREMNAGYEFWHSSDVDYEDPNILIYAIEPELLEEFEQKFAAARRERQ